MEQILIVEDNKMIAKVMTHLIGRDLNFSCVVANNLKDAKTLLASPKSDFLVAVLDLNLPDAPNGEVVDYVLAKGISVIVLTGTYSEKVRENFLNKNVVDYVVKESRYSYEYVVRIIKRLDRNRYIKTMVVDDSLPARGFIRSLLRAHNYQVLDAVDGKQALVVLQNNPEIRLVITDYQMPNMDGFELTTTIRRDFNCENMAIIGLSAEGSGTLSAKFIKNGANDFLTKPFSHEEFYCRVMQNIESLEYLEEIRDMANRDHLTKLFNRRYFFSEGGKVYEDAQKKGQSVVGAMMDIDYFKSVNDNYGHAMGDQVLVSFVHLINEHLSQYLVARIGGEEFSVIFFNCTVQQAYEQLEKFRISVEQFELAIENQDPLKFTVSIGLSHGIPKTLDNLLSEADLALYQAKENGRNQIVISE